MKTTTQLSDLSDMPDWKLHGYKNEYEWSCYQSFQKDMKGEEYDNYKTTSENNH